MKRIGYCQVFRKVLLVTGLAAALFVPMRLMAQLPSMNPNELAMLPPYCKYTQYFRDHVPGGNDLAKIKEWYAIMGGSWPTTGIFHAMHHYCEGLLDVNFAKFHARTPQERQARLEASIRQFDYVIRSSQPGEKLLPEFFTKKGESLVALGRGPQAAMEFNRAIEIKPDYWPPYASLSDYYKSIGNIKLAREALERGLAASPDARALSRRLAEIDPGKDRAKSAPKPATAPPPPSPAPQEKAADTPQQIETPQPAPAEK